MSHNRDTQHLSDVNCVTLFRPLKQVRITRLPVIRLETFPERLTQLCQRGPTQDAIWIGECFYGFEVVVAVGLDEGGGANSLD